MPGSIYIVAVRYLTAVGIGVLTGIVTAMLWIIIRIVLPIIVAPLAVSLLALRQPRAHGGLAAAG
jgi:hypothetical protein